jgi:hypothetical protein
MSSPMEYEIDLEGSIEIAEGIYWIGFYDQQAGLHCNPYLIVDNDEAMVIDGGSRPDLSPTRSSPCSTSTTTRIFAAVFRILKTS